jgi:beta-xylosidase
VASSLFSFCKMPQSILPLLIFLSFTSLAQSTTYTNPVSDSIFIADPFVLQHQGEYYLYGTSAEDGFRAWRSDNLVDWDSLGYVYRPSENSWASGNFWAPEVIHYRRKFYLIFSAKGINPDGLRICLAVSDSPTGPFEDLHVPLFDIGHSCIDGHLFVDDGRPYLYYEMVGVVGQPRTETGYFWGMIFGVQLSDDLSRFVESEPKLCIYPTQDWENPTGTLARSTEGMTVFRHDSTYYMTYSANHYTDPQYGVGYATASHPLGPWTKSVTNPILSQNPKIGVSGPGHSSIIRSPDRKELFIVYHSHADPNDPSPRRVLNIDRLVVAPNGQLRAIGPTRSPQPVPTH